MEWISVKDRLPEVEESVLVSISRYSEYTKKNYTLTTCAIYEDGSVNVEDSCWCCDNEYSDYNEEEDIYVVPCGWYEYHEYGNTEEDGIGIISDDGCLRDKVTHWMPLPEPPKGE